jgi:hypothetical protein
VGDGIPGRSDGGGAIRAGGPGDCRVHRGQLLNLPFTMDFTEWFAPESVCVALSVVALA